MIIDFLNVQKVQQQINITSIKIASNKEPDEAGNFKITCIFRKGYDSL